MFGAQPIFKVFTALLLTLAPGVAVSECMWAWNYNQKAGRHENASQACAVGLSTISAWDRKLTRIERTEGSAVVFKCHVMLQACKTCSWTTPNPPWRPNGLDLTAHLVNEQGYTLSSTMVDNETGTCIRPDVSSHLGPSEPQQCSASFAAANESGDVGNPINSLTGNKYQFEQIYRSPSGAIDVSLIYNTYNPRWLHSYSDRLAITPGYIYYYNSQGRSFTFLRSGSSITSITAKGGVLTQTTSGYELVQPLAGRIKFDPRGRMIEVARGGKGRITITYSTDSVLKFTSTSIPQRKLTLTSELGETVTLNDDSIGGFTRLSSGTFIAAFGFYTTGIPAFLIKSIDGVSSPLRSYIYGDSRFPKYLTAIIDERRLKYATWTYDAQGRAISSEHIDGADKVSITYNGDGSSTVTNPLGKTTIYRTAYFGGIKRITSIQGEPSANCPNSNSIFTYDSRGLLKSKTDNEGNVTIFNYNEHDLEVSRTEAAGTPLARTITTEWHPTLFLPAVVTEPNRIIRYQYDAQGRQLSRTVDTL